MTWNDLRGVVPDVYKEKGTLSKKRPRRRKRAPRRTKTTPRKARGRRKTRGARTVSYTHLTLPTIYAV